MQRVFSIIIPFFLLTFFSHGTKAEENKVRKSPIAGAWYPADTKELKRYVEDAFEKASPPEIKGNIFGIISPHAGIQWSGQAAAYGYKLMRGKNIKRVILMGPSHYMAFHGIATSEVDYYETPLGKVNVDREISDALSKQPLFSGPRGAELREHSLEMQLPFLQIALGDFSLVPLVVGDMHEQDFDVAAKALKPYMGGATLIVASSDFTHYGARFRYLHFQENIKQNLKKLDGDAIERIIKKDFDGYFSYLGETKITICGARPIGIFLKMLPATSKGSLLTYYTSGDLTQDFSSTVSYASIVFTTEKQ
jgi:AmmeMemoRadiSam system protein B